MTKRDEILEAAREVYLAEGPEGLTMRRLADEVDVTPGAIYRHYEGKREVLLEVVAEAQRTMLEYLTRALEGETPLERVRLANEAYLDFALEQRRLYEVLYATPELLGLEDLPDEARDRARAIRQFWQDRVTECVDAGLLEADEPRTTGLTLWAHSHGLISLYHRGMLDVDEEAFRRVFRASRRRALVGVATPEHARRLREEGAGHEATGEPAAS